MGKKSKKFQNEDVVECKCCEGIISVGFHLGRGDLLCCDECGAEYLIKVRKPMRLELVKDDDEEDYLYMNDHEDDDYFNLSDFGYGDDGYNDGRDY